MVGKKKLNRYELRIDVKAGAKVSAIAMVLTPAMESNFLAFSKQEEFEFSANDDKQELLGYALIPNQVIYRKDAKTGEEFEVVFTADSIRGIAQQYMKMGYQNNMNIGHTSIPAKSFIYQAYIVDFSKNIQAPKGLESIDGGWVVGVKVEDKNVWNDIKEGKIKGFSVEGIFQFIETNFNKETDEDFELIQLLNQINKIISNNKK